MPQPPDDSLPQLFLSPPASLTGGTGDWTEDDRTAQAPATVGRFRLLREIARGGMGVVYSALDPQFGREVAVKMLHRSLAVGPEFTRRFDEEARITGQLQHPCIPAVFEVGKLDDG